MTPQNFVTLPREVVEQLTDALANRCGTNSDEWSLINTVRAALTEQVQPSPDQIDHAEKYADCFNDSQPTRADIVNAVYWGMRFKQAQPTQGGSAELRRAVERTREDLGAVGTNYPDVRVLMSFAEQSLLQSNAERVPLSDKQICAIEREVALSMLNNHATDAIAFARAIEAEITKGQQ